MCDLNKQTLTPARNGSPGEAGGLPSLPRSARDRLLKREGANDGITLIEALVSLTVLLVGIVGLLSAWPHGSNWQKRAADKTIAIGLAQAKIEELSALSYENLAVGTIENRVRQGQAPSDPFYRFTRDAAVTLLNQNLNPTDTDIGLKKITVTVYYPAGLNKSEQKTELVYLKSKR